MSARAAWARAGVVLAVIAGADQGCKALAKSAVERGDSESIFLGVKLVNVRNSGVAFGALQDGGAIIAIVTGLAICALLAYFAVHATRPLAWLPVGMLLGGAIGNVIDRVGEGAVVDFIKLPAWPAFNVADMSITFGVVGLLLVIERADGARGRA